MRTRTGLFHPGYLLLAALALPFFASPARCQDENANPTGENASPTDENADPKDENLVTEGLNTPAPPENDYPIADYAELLDEEQEKRLAEIQLKSYTEHDTPLVVVTIKRMSDYGPRDWSIERFGFTWFNKWGMAKKGPEGELINRAILLLVSVGDRKARIELGAEWGRAWDTHCSRIMNNAIVSRFKKGDFPGGIEAGVKELSKMAGMDPGQSPPRSSAPRSSSRGRPSHSTGFGGLPTMPSVLIILLVVGGFALIGISFKYPEKQKQLLIAGIVLIAIGVFTYLVLILVVVLFGSKGGGGGGGGGDYSGGGGGFGGGGFSGGGGASGSW